MSEPMELINAYMDGRATDDQFVQLVEWIEASKQNARAFQRIIVLEQQMIDDLHRRETEELAFSNKATGGDECDGSGFSQMLAALDDVHGEASAPVDISDVILDRQRKAEAARQSRERSLQCLGGHISPVDTKPRTRHYVIPKPLFYGSIASVVAVAALIIWSLIPDRGQVQPQPQVLGTVVSARGLEWFDDEQSLIVGDSIFAEPMQFKAGTLTIRFAQGGVATFKGPVRFEPSGRNELALQQGSMSAEVPPAATGFTVAVPGGRVVDLGTKFEVDVHESGESEVRVRKGTVRALRIDQKGDILHQLLLNERMAARIDPAAQQLALLESGEVDPGGVVRNQEFVNIGKDAGKARGFGEVEGSPTVCRLGDGRLFAVFNVGYGVVSPPSARYPRGGLLMSAISDDEGHSWSRPRVFFDSDDDDRHPSLARLRNGRIICTFFTFAGDGTRSTQLRYSDDDGTTWSDVGIAFDASNSDVGVAVTELSDGRLAMPVYLQVGIEELKVGVSFSDDGGENWAQPVMIPESSEPVAGEPALIEQGDGRLLVVVRGSRRMVSSESLDGGVTWTVPRTHEFAAQGPSLLQTGKGLLLAYRPALRKPIEIRRSFDGGRTWSKPERFDQYMGSYPEMLELNDGTILVVYHREGLDSDVVSFRIRVTEAGIEKLPL